MDQDPGRIYVDALLQKPVPRNELFAALKQVSGALPGGEDAPERPQEPSRVMRVLAAEDNKTNQMVVDRMLGKMGVEVTLVENGSDAVDTYVTSDFDLILMDLSLPRMDGWTATRTLRGDAATGAIPVVALTAHASAEDRERALGAGCSDYLTKPVERGQLVRAIRKNLNRT